VQSRKSNYESIRAAIARRDLAAVEAHARKLRDEHLAQLVRRVATSTWSYIRTVRRHAGSSRLDLPSH